MDMEHQKFLDSIFQQADKAFDGQPLAHESASDDLLASYVGSIVNHDEFAKDVDISGTNYVDCNAAENGEEYATTKLENEDSELEYTEEDEDDENEEKGDEEEDEPEEEGRRGCKRLRINELCDYEVRRQQNIDSNHAVLMALGLAKDPLQLKKQKQSQKKRQPKKAVVKEEFIVRRFQPDRRRKQRGFDYSEAEGQLDDCEKQLRKRKMGERERKPIVFFNGDDYDFKPRRAPRLRSSQRETIHTTKPTGAKRQQDDTEEEPSKSLNELQHERLFGFDFTANQVEEAGAHPDDVQAFSLYCAERANRRFHQLTDKYSADDIVAAAICIDCDDTFIDQLDVTLVHDYKAARDNFKCNKNVLASYRGQTYVGANPKVICPHCDLPFALKCDGHIRDHSGCLKDRYPHIHHS